MSAVNFIKNFWRNYRSLRLVLSLGGFLFYCGNISSQNVGRQLANILYGDAEVSEKVERTNHLIDSLEAAENDSLHVFYDRYAYWLYDFVGRKEAITYQEKSLELALSQAKIDTAFVQGSSFNLAWYYTKDKQYLKSIDTYKNVVLMDNSSNTAITAYLKLGYSYSSIQDYYNAIKYFKLAISLLDTENGNRQKLREAYQNLAYNYLRIKTLESIKEGRKYGKLADSLIEIIPTSPLNRYNIKYVQAQLHNRDEDINFDISRTYYDQALEVAMEAQDSTKIMTIYLGYGVLYKHFDSERAIDYLNKALQFSRPIDSFYTYQVYTSLGYNEDLKKNPEKSVALRHKALEYLTGSNFMDHRKSYDTIFINSETKVDLLHAVPRLGEAYLNYYEATNDPELLDKSIAYFTMADRIIDLLKLNSSEYRSRLFWRRLSTDLYSKAIRACYLKNDPEQAFYFMEKNKALLLLEDIFKERFRNSLELPLDYLNEEKAFQKQIIHFENLLKDKTLTSSKQDSIKKIRIDLEIAFSKLKDSVEKKEDLIKFDPEITTLITEQAELEEDEIVIEYHISIDSGYGIYTNNDRGYALVIGGNDVRLYEIPNLPTLKEESLELLELIKTPFRTEDDIQNYTKLSYNLFERLFPSNDVRQKIKDKKLRIIPDSYLSFLPYEALSTSSETLKYLISETTVQYQYSNSFLNNIRSTAEPNNRYLAMIPEEFAATGLPPLVYSSNEIDALDANYNGNKFTHNQATKINFLENLKNYGIIHLATHANAQDSISPWVAFYDGKLSLEELYLAPNNASLVFLSGCNTTVGKQETGEGVMSLARGFFYSGAKSVISSLWSIDDRSTSELVTNFYENLAEDRTKSDALRNAKLEYLETHTLSEASPYYWASFIVMGDDSQIPQSFWTQYNFIIVGFASVFLLILIWIFRRRRSTRI